MPPSPDGLPTMQWAAQISSGRHADVDYQPYPNWLFIFLAITFDKGEIFQHLLLQCILHETMYQMIYNIMIFKNTKVLPLMEVSGLMEMGSPCQSAG